MTTTTIKPAAHRHTSTTRAGDAAPAKPAAATAAATAPKPTGASAASGMAAAATAAPKPDARTPETFLKSMVGKPLADVLAKATLAGEVAREVPGFDLSGSMMVTKLNPKSFGPDVKGASYAVPKNASAGAGGLSGGGLSGGPSLGGGFDIGGPPAPAAPAPVSTSGGKITLSYPEKKDVISDYHVYPVATLSVGADGTISGYEMTEKMVELTHEEMAAKYAADDAARLAAKPKPAPKPAGGPIEVDTVAGVAAAPATAAGKITGKVDIVDGKPVLKLAKAITVNGITSDVIRLEPDVNIAPAQLKALGTITLPEGKVEGRPHFDLMAEHLRAGLDKAFLTDTLGLTLPTPGFS